MKIIIKNKIISLVLISLALFNSCKDGISNNSKFKSSQLIHNEVKKSKMQIEIWSDVMCPFCYIGKRKFEKALEQFSNRENIEIIWKSFQLNPDMKTEPNKNSIIALAEQKGISIQESNEMHKYVVEMANSVGLKYNMEKTIAANSFNAHRLTHFAKSKGLQLEMEEKLFEAYFILGKNIDDKNTLIEIGESIGLNKVELEKTMYSNDYAANVNNDIYEAQQVGARGVPFFVFDKKYAISGAQESSTFLQTLEKSFTEWQKSNPEKALKIVDGKVCSPEKDCK